MEKTFTNLPAPKAQSKDYRRLQVLFIITTLIGTVCVGFIFYFIIKYYSAQPADAEPMRFVLFVTAFIPAVITSILVFIDYLALRYLKQLQIPNQNYLLPHLSIILNSIPPLIIMITLLWAIFSI